MATNGEGNPPTPPGNTNPPPGDQGGPPSTNRRGGNNANNQRHQNARNTSGNSATTFRGDTEGMRGYVFELPAKGSQLTETLDMLKRFSSTTYDTGRWLATLFAKKPAMPAIEKPPDDATPTGTDKAGNPRVTDLDRESFKEQVKSYWKDVRDLQRDLAALFAVIYGQCNHSLRAHVSSQADYPKHELSGNCLWLLAEIRGAMTRFDKTQHVHQALHELRMRFYSDYQGQRSTVAYYHAFDALVKTMDENNAWSLPPLAQDPKATGRTDVEIRRNIRERELATAFILNADNRRFGNLKADLKSNYARGTDQWPSTVMEAYNLLITTERNDAARARRKRRGDPNNPSNPPGPRGHTFTMTSDDGRLSLPPGSLLLDSESSSSIFADANLLSDIKASDSPLVMHTNGGKHIARRKGIFHGLGSSLSVWHQPQSLTNILALRDVRRVARVTLDTDQELAFLVHLPDGEVMRFSEHDSGLYIYSPADNDVRVPLTAYSCLQTVSSNRALFTRRENAGADAARALYRHLGRPSVKRFTAYIDNGLIRNCPVTPADVKRAHHIYGPDIAFLKGKTTQRPPSKHLATIAPTPLPSFIETHHSELTICVDFFYVQRNIFLHFISRKIGYRSSVAVANRSKSTIMKAVKQEIARYTNRGFTVVNVFADQEFECIRSDLASLHHQDNMRHIDGPIGLETCTTNEHVKEVERSIRTMKDTIRATVHGLPYKRLPRQIIQGLVEHTTTILNSFPYQEGVSKTLSPDTIVNGKPPPDYNDYLLEFGSYVMLTDKTTNTPRARSFGAIALNATGNQDKSYRFMSLVTGEIVTRAPGYWTELVISDPAIARVEVMAKDQGQPPLQGSNLLVEWSPDQQIDDDEYDKDFEPVEDDELTEEDDLDNEFYQQPLDDEHEQADDDFPTTATEQLQPTQEESQEAPIESQEDLIPSNQGEAPTQPTQSTNGEDAGAQTNNDAIDGSGETLPESLGDHMDETVVPHGESPSTLEPEPDTSPDTQMPDSTGDQHHSYNLRGNRSRSYHHRLAHSMDNPTSGKSYEPPTTTATQLFQTSDQKKERESTETADQERGNNEVRRILHGWVMTQMSAKAGIRRFGNVAKDAMKKEFRQLDEKGVFKPVLPKDLQPEVKSQALRCINVTKQKRCGKIKGRTCADGRPQRGLYDKSETSSPTASSDAILLTLVIDAVERRDVATADVAGAYLNAEMEDFVLMKLEGQDAELMCEVNHAYKEYISKDKKGRPVLYLRLARALYGCVKSAMLWYKLFTGTLQKLGFKLNPYDSCVANANIAGSQCTIVWYVDDNKISHVDPSVVSGIIAHIEKHFGTMTVTRGDEHEFLGMRIKFDRESGTVEINMASYLRDAIQESGLDIRRHAATPATANHFDSSSHPLPLERAAADRFRSIVCKLLYVGLRARTDILTSLSYLSTRITHPTEGDRRKLKRLLEYLHGTLDLSLILGADHLGSLYTWVDASYATHDDMKSHTGGVISFGLGGLMCKSAKQKLNTKSSTEAELVGASDYLPSTIWAMHFLRAQGYPILHSHFAQDNQSAIKLEQNGRSSAGQKSRHIHIRYFWITDRLKAHGIHLHHCPTEAMLADFFTKPIQGNLFRRFRAVLLGHAPITSLRPKCSPVPQERVEDCVTADNGAPDASDGKTITWSDVVQGSREGSLILSK